MDEEVPEAAAPVGGGGDDEEMAAARPADSRDSDSSDSDDDEGAGAGELRIQTLEQTLQEQPLDYETNVQVSHLSPPRPPQFPWRARVLSGFSH
jgi:squamous cell carcinoma antigen recognized by T-cells 3